MRGRWINTLAKVAIAAFASTLQPQLMRAQDSLAATPAAAARVQIFLRAQRLVNDGNGSDGRALVDSLLNATEPRSAEEAEVLYWRATLAESWDHAQRDYLRVMLEHERSRFAASAMFRLAQGEAMRGDREAALRYVERLLVEAPNAAERSEALALRARLTGVAQGSTAPADSAAGTRPTPATQPPPSQPQPPTPSPVTASPPSAATSSASPPSGGMLWSVQIAAFPTAAEAAAFAAEIRERGYDTRVDGIAAPFRVRFGRYATRAAAAAAMDAYKAKERGDAFLAQVPR